MIFVGTSFVTPKHYGFYIETVAGSSDWKERRQIWEALKAHVLGYR